MAAATTTAAAAAVRACHGKDRESTSCIDLQVSRLSWSASQLHRTDADNVSPCLTVSGPAGNRIYLCKIPQTYERVQFLLANILRATQTQQYCSGELIAASQMLCVTQSQFHFFLRTFTGIFLCVLRSEHSFSDGGTFLS